MKCRSVAPGDGPAGDVADRRLWLHLVATAGMGWSMVLAILITGYTAHGQQAAKVPRIGFLASAVPATYTTRLPAFEQSLRDLGYKSIAIEARYADGKSDRLAELAAQLIELKVDVILATSDASVRAAMKATQTIPIVFVNTGDPVSDGFIASLAHPGGNATGLTLLYPELSGKRLELLKEAFPKVSRLALLFGSRSSRLMNEQSLAAQALGISVISLPLAAPSDIEAAFEKARQERAQGLLTNPAPQTTSARPQILEFSTKNRLPAMYPSAEDVTAGGLMSYGPSAIEQYRRAATYVDKILKGAKPGDLPVEQPMKFEFVVNLKTAKQIGVTIPPNVLARANQVFK